MADTPFSLALDKIEQGLAPYGLAVAYERKLTRSDEEGDVWSVLATDGENSESLIVSLSASERAKVKRELETEDIEHAVEHRAGAYPLETRLADLATHGEIVLTASELNKFT